MWTCRNYMHPLVICSILYCKYPRINVKVNGYVITLINRWSSDVVQPMPFLMFANVTWGYLSRHAHPRGKKFYMHSWSISSVREWSTECSLLIPSYILKRPVNWIPCLFIWDPRENPRRCAIRAGRYSRFATRNASRNALKRTRGFSSYASEETRFDVWIYLSCTCVKNECISREALTAVCCPSIWTGVRSAGLNFVQQVCPGCLQLPGSSDCRIRPMTDIRMPG